ncbi:MAG: HD domain-containing protein [Rubripirellula sp.]|nr:HD domain-containing protein [Rubripirellula sp.]
MSDVDFLSISVATLLPVRFAGIDLYQKQTGSERLILYRSAEYPITREDLDSLRVSGVHRLFISKASRTDYQRYLRKIVTVDDPRSIPLSARTSALNEVVRDVLYLAFTKGNVDQTVNAAKQLGVLVADILTKDDFSASDLFRVLHDDYATFTHSANVAFYCGILVAELGFSQTEIEQVTTGGLLHDLGKLDIEEGILSKPGPLSLEEFLRVRMYPYLGYQKLVSREDLVEGQLMMVYQHRERLDGKGYPKGCCSEDIHQWAKICAVVDVFEALTSRRPYRSSMTHDDALALQQRDIGTAFDPNILECWASIVQRDFLK